MPLEFRRERVETEIWVPTEDGYEPRRLGYEARWDPLTGQVAKLIPTSRMTPASEFDLEAFGKETEGWCPFCGEKAEKLTPRFPETLYPDGRIRRGEALCFPNLAPYARHASVAIYGSARHYLPLERMTPRLVTDALAVQVEFAKAATGFDPAAPWVALSANHMLPSGSSLFHPHLQGSVDPYPTTFQRLLSEVPGERFGEYLKTERRLGERYLGSTGCVEWLTAFAPVGFHELRAFLPDFRSPEQLPADVVEELGAGLAVAFNLYAELGMQSFNLALYGAPPTHGGYVLNLRLVSRSNLQPLYRSDATYFERVHWTALLDQTPEELAQRAADRFRR